jgi:hypothetical protein
MLCAVAVAIMLALGSQFGQAEEAQQMIVNFDTARYGIGTWQAEGLGNHRVVVTVAAKAAAVRVHVPWRRRDADPQKKAVLVFDAKGTEIKNVVRININREYGDLVFEPAAGAGTYYLYYMPFTKGGNDNSVVINYLPPASNADPAWVAANHLTKDELKQGAWQTLLEAKVVEIQAINDFHRFDPMEVIATRAEIKQLQKEHTSESYLLFPEDRKFPIRMTKDLPLRWIECGPQTSFTGEACKNEFYVFQIGVYALQKDLSSLKIQFSDLKSATGKTIPAAALRCFNMGGNDFVGHHFDKKVSVKKDTVQALWFGIDVPRNVNVGNYTGTVTIKPANAPATAVKVTLAVIAQVLQDRGDSELWRLARLRWLDSKIGIDDTVVKSYTPLKVNGNAISCLGRTITFAGNGLPKSIQSGKLEVLAKPMNLTVETASGTSKWNAGKLKVLKAAPGAVYLEAQSQAGALAMNSRIKMEADGYINYRVTLKASRALKLQNIQLEIPMCREMATYMVGLGAQGGYRPQMWKWDWAAKGSGALWVGEVKAGLYCVLKKGPDGWDLENSKALTTSEVWNNQGQGGYTVAEDGDEVIQKAFTGPMTLKAGEEIDLRFALMATPLKPLNPEHFAQRYFQFYSNIVTPQEGKNHLATIMTIHQGNELNPYINYPFLTVDKMKAYIDDAHKLGMRTKIYYTVRELSNFCAEIWALRSLNNEVFTDGAHGGDSWLREHLIDNYGAAWHQIYPNGEIDAAIANTGVCRWQNYYLEGIAWLSKHIGMDGIYLDGTAFDREGMKRMRKALDSGRPGGLFDLHDGDNYKYVDARNSPIIEKMELLPYVDSLWYGEIYDYQNSSPDYWLVECSGIPFGLYGDMLQMPINPWRGMVFGMAGRYWFGMDPQYVWKLWEDFGIKDAQMIGWWDPNCPVWTGHKDLKATVYRKQGESLIAIGSWAREATAAWDYWPTRLRLRIDWKALGLDPKKVKLYAPAIPGFQDEATFAPTDEIPVKFGQGWALIARETKK